MNSAAQSNWTLFCLLCRILGGVDKEAIHLATSPEIFKRLVGIAAAEDMLPALATRVDEQKPSLEPESAPELEILKAALKSNTMLNMQITAQAMQIAYQLNKKNIQPLFLKGTALLLTTYKEKLGFRKQVDIDFIVEPERLKEACSILLNCGYSFYQESLSGGDKPLMHRDMDLAIKASAAHHHLPPLVKEGFSSTVELHTHFLPKEFQKNTTMQLLFDSAQTIDFQSCKLRVLSPEFMIANFVMGTFVHDGHKFKRTFPIREACDYIDVSAHCSADSQLIGVMCGKNFSKFHYQTAVLMGLAEWQSKQPAHGSVGPSFLMARRYNSKILGDALDAYARARHLATSIFYSPTKLPAYALRQLRR